MIKVNQSTHVRSCVPQGSILGPTLFPLFINDLPLFLKNCCSDLYADDATIHTHSKDKQTIENNLQSDFIVAKYWSRNNKMSIHDQKTSCMTLGTKQRLGGSHLFNIKAFNTNIKQVSYQKRLGLHIDENLNWSTHIDQLSTTVASKLSYLRQLSEYNPINVQKIFYQWFIFPLLDYDSIIWGSTSAANIKKTYQNCKNEPHELF